jgi:metallo-beta-lactamase family protein
VAELTFVGAAGTVTGSKHLLTAGGRHIFIDCGLFQGTGEVTALNNAPLPVDPKDVEAVVVTHGHLDHAGYLPKLVHDGFSGTIFATPATRELMVIVLEDAAGLQEHLHRRGLHEEHYAPPPFYSDADVRQTIALTKTVPLEESFEAAGLKATYRNAAHIIGSAFVEFEIGGRSIVFSGDMGRYNRMLLYDPSPIGCAGTLVCESTYGDRVHPGNALESLSKALVGAAERGGAAVIPAFAVERAQEILFSIGELQRTTPALAGIPVFLDSPMAAKVDDLFARFPDAHKPVDFQTNGKPFGCDHLTVAITTDESKAINTVRGPHIIVSASGMAAGGRVLHHLYNHVPDPKATIVFVGYQSLGTLGFFLTHGARTIRVLGDNLPVRAAVSQIGGFSAHADQTEIQRWLDTCTSKPRFYAVHGDPPAAEALCGIVRSRYTWVANPAVRGTTVIV